MALSMKKVEAEQAKDITNLFEFIDEFQPVLDDEKPPADFLQSLVDNEHYMDAVTFLAHALKPREAVWWACVCARHHFDDADEKFQEALKAAEAWVYDPTEENRRNCEKLAEAGDYSGAACWASAGAFWSGGSITPQGDPEMEVLPYIYAHAVAGSIISSAGYGQPDEDVVNERFKEYIQHGTNIADGGNG